MCELDYQGKRLLDLLVGHFSNVKPGKPETYITYKEVHDRLNLSLNGDTYGTSLQHQGLNSLADWTAHKKFPGITGLIVKQNDRMPGNGYFELFNKQNTDFQWWENEIRKSIAFDWSNFY